MVKTFKCPEVRLPDDLINTGKKKRKLDHFKEDDGHYKTKFKNEINDDRISFEKTFSAIKKINGSTLTGLSRIKHKGDKLSKLGVPPPKQPTMPFKMKIGIEQGRKKRASKQLEYAKTSGLVTAQKSQKSSNSKSKEFSRKDDFEVRTYGGVLKVNKNQMFSRNNR